MVQETLLLYTSDLILLTMAIDKLTELGWKYPAVDQDGNPVDSQGIADMLLAQASSKATAMDPFAAQGGELPPEEQVPPGAPETNGQPQTVDLGVT
jgi:hypothetical protein